MIENTRFPHTVEIYRASSLNDEPVFDDDGNEVTPIVFTSACGLRTVNKYADINAKVIEADYRLSLFYSTVYYLTVDTVCKL